MSVAPSSLLAAYAVDTAADPWWGSSSRGMVRIMPNPRLGFPLGPFGICRGPIYQDLTPATMRWYPRRSTALPTLVEGELWGSIVPPPDNPEPPMVVIHGCNSDHIDVAAMSPRPLVRAARSGLLEAGWEGETDPNLLSSIRLGTPNIRTVRITSDYANLTHVLVAHPNIESIAEEVGVLGLPLGWIEGGNRVAYLGLDDGGGQAYDRIRAEAPFTYPPYVSGYPLDDPNRPVPTGDDEVRRVESLVERDVVRMLKDHLYRVGDGAAAPIPVSNVAAYPPGTAGTLDEHGSIWIAAADPGIARWLGLMGAFEPWDGDTPTVVTVGGVWVLEPDHPDLAAVLNASDSEVVGWIMRRNGLDDVVELAWQYEREGWPVAWLWTQAFAPPVLGNEFVERPSTPVLASPGGSWGRAGGRDIHRVAHQVANAVPLGTIGVTREMDGSGEVPIQPPVDGVDYAHRPLMVTPDTFFLDQLPDANPGPVTWSVWQADAFGRWSDAAARVGMTIARPDLPVPSPVVRMLPDLGSHTGTAPYTTLFEVTIPVPERVPGQVDIDAVELELPWLAIDPLRLPVAPVVAFADLEGVPTLPATTATASLRAWFIGVDGSRSAAGTVAMTFNDPRPPVPVPPPPVLTFTSRDAATGQALAHVPLPRGNGIDRYRVFFTNETRLRTVLRTSGESLPAAGAIRDDRARAWLAIMPRVPRVAFDALTTEGTVPPGEYLHAVSGTLAEIAFYRIVPVGANGAEAPFARCPVLPFAVPYPDRPVRPQVWTTQAEGRIALHLQALPGAAQGVRWRVRAARRDVSDPRLGEVIGAGDLDGDGRATFAVPELRPFTPIVLVAEVLGAAERGNPDQPGLWSEPSRPVTVETIPESAPPIIDWAMATVAGNELVVQVRLDPALVTEPPAAYRLQVFQAAGLSQVPTLVAEGEPGDALRAPLVPGGRQFVVAVDPLGRMAPRVDIGILPPDPVDPP